jgi:hypothetical protein
LFSWCVFNHSQIDDAYINVDALINRQKKFHSLDEFSILYSFIRLSKKDNTVVDVSPILTAAATRCSPTRSSSPLLFYPQQPARLKMTGWWRRSNINQNAVVW